MKDSHGYQRGSGLVLNPRAESMDCSKGALCGGLGDEYWMLKHTKERLWGLDFSLPLEGMEPHIQA